MESVSAEHGETSILASIAFTDDAGRSGGERAG